MKLNKILFLVIILAAVNCFAQETKWTRIEFEKTVSVSVPDGFLVDVEKNSGDRKFRIMYYIKDFQIELNIYKSDYSKQSVNNYRMETNDSEKIEVEKIIARRLISTMYDLKSNVVVIGTKKLFYNLRVQMKSEDDPIAMQFINSIKINGKIAFPQKSENISEVAILDSTLKTSSEIQSAWNRVVSKSEEYTNASSIKEIMKQTNPTEKYLREPIFIENPYYSISKNIIPEILSILLSGNRGKDLGKIAASVKLLANGETGEIKIFSTADKKMTKFVVRAIRGLKCRFHFYFRK
jgi:hypothetical protein